MDALEYSVCQDNGWTYRPVTQAKATTPTATNASTETDSDTSWETFVTHKLHAAREFLSELYPLTYRVEILEDIFSLLFVRHEYFRNEGTNVQSDSGGEEGLVDDDWQDKSITSLESVEISEPLKSNQYGPAQNFQQQQQNTKEVTFRQTSTSKTDQVSGDLSVEKTAARKSSVPSGGILKQRSSGLLGNGSSEASQYSNNSLSLQGKVGFVASEKFTHDVLSILKECMLDLTSTKFALLGPSAGKTDSKQRQGQSDQTAREMSKYMKCSVKPSTLAQRISKLSQHINESWWRFQLVSQSKQSASAGRDIHESSSDEEWRSVVRESDGDDGDGAEGRKKRKKKKRNGNRSRSASGK